MLDLGGLLGESVERATARFGVPVVDTSAAGERWLVFDTAVGRLRARARAAPDEGTFLLRSWTLTFSEPFDDIDEASSALGLSLEPPLPEDLAGEGGLARRGLLEGPRGASLTAAGAPGAFRSLTAFDEPPDWRGEPRP